ncbi:MAG: hypothetical protein ACRDD8_12980 [Bacteroidales bacterium]
MNLIDFHVTKIIEEKRDKIYKLYGMTETDLQIEASKGNFMWTRYLGLDGIYQKYEYIDEGGYRVDTHISTIEEAYYVGYKGQH